MKNRVWYFVAIGVAGLVMIAVSFLYGDVLKNADTIRSFGFGFTGASIFRLILSWRNSRPKYQARHEEEMRRRNIELNDEMKIMLRQKAAHITYIVMMQVLLFGGVVLLFVGVDTWVTTLLFLMMLFHYLLGVGIYYRLLGKQTKG